VEHRSTADGCFSIVIRRRGRPEESQSISRNYAIIRTLQTEVEGRLAARPGVYDGRKTLLTTFNLGFESDVHEASQSYHRSSPSSTFSLLSSM
jgi:hypothetical protein